MDDHVEGGCYGACGQRDAEAAWVSYVDAKLRLKLQRRRRYAWLLWPLRAFKGLLDNRSERR